MYYFNKKTGFMISVIGGTYKEINLDNLSKENFGSGLRSVYFLLENEVEVNFYTAGNNEVKDYLEVYKNSYNSFSYDCKFTNDFITFKYYFGLDNPNIYPNSSKINKSETISVYDKNIICFGMLESNFEVNGDYVIYDPQTSSNPYRFSDFGRANKLIYIVNFNEAKSISRKNNISDIVEFFFNEEGVFALIIKNGPHGAKLFTRENIKGHLIPSYITQNVFKIGSGDIFTTSFSYYLIVKGFSLEKAALYASKTTALYCDKQIIKTNNLENYVYDEFTNSLDNKQIYLASPIFSLSDLILVDKIREIFLDFGVKVFSPFHDIGLGNDDEIAKKDLEGLNQSDIIFSIVDGLDSGTLIELGYGMAKNKKIISYHRTNEEESLIMLTPSNIKIFDNLTSAIYNTIWSL
ncbi:hypothetical protein EG350_11165 [Chryseobacterium shandongense]|nr:hypothetical protein EG350_11165 [Chryseobacterium shandongense]